MKKDHKYIVIWLFTTAFFVFCMAVIGAITRLTESGLSMVEWRPLIGTIPPLSQDEWLRVFELYKQTPEYQKEHFWMELEDFKTIFFWEWFHRFWGRLIGLIYALPLLVFWIKDMIPAGYKIRLAGILILGGAQAVMGWYMVESGLVDMPSVSHYRLAAHLGLAFVIFGALVWTAFDIQKITRVYTPPSRNFINMAGISFGFLTLTILWGAYVAGLDAGLVYNSWPLMGDHFLPEDPFVLVSIFEDPVWVQFTHRWIAIIAAISLICFAWFIRSILLIFAIILQVLLGISTLLSQVWIPLAAMHQAGAFILLFVFLLCCHKQIYKNSDID